MRACVRACVRVLCVFPSQASVDVCASCGAANSSTGCSLKHTQTYEQFCSACGAAPSSAGCSLNHPRGYESFTEGFGFFTKYKWMCCNSRDQSAPGCTKIHPPAGIKRKWMCCNSEDQAAAGCTQFHPAALVRDQISKQSAKLTNNLIYREFRMIFVINPYLLCYAAISRFTLS